MMPLWFKYLYDKAIKQKDPSQSAYEGIHTGMLALASAIGSMDTHATVEGLLSGCQSMVDAVHSRVLRVVDGTISSYMTQALVMLLGLAGVVLVVYYREALGIPC
jgi:hypothetical protein